MDGQLARDYGRLRGLIRRQKSTTGGTRFCFVNGDLADGWIQDTSLLKHWLDPGSEQLAEVDRAQAKRLAADLGVPGLDLDGEPVAVDRDGDGVLSSATKRPQADAINVKIVWNPADRPLSMRARSNTNGCAPRKAVPAELKTLSLM